MISEKRKMEKTREERKREQYGQKAPWLDIMSRIKKVHYKEKMTIVIWTDGSKTIVKCNEQDTYDPEKGLAMAILKRISGNTNGHRKLFERFVP